MLIRKGTPGDALSLGEFATRTFYQAYAWYNTDENMRNYSNRYFSKEKMKSELCNDASIYLIVEENNIIVGYVKLGNQNNHPQLIDFSHSEIERIYVDNSIQRNGIGKKLLASIIEHAKVRNNQYIWLGVWQKNEKALAFYKKNGFEIFGTTQFLLGDDLQDDYLMKKNIEG